MGGEEVEGVEVGEESLVWGGCVEIKSLLSYQSFMSPVFVKAGFNLSIETVSCLPLMSTVKYLSEQSITRNGPSYGGWSDDQLASCLMKTNLADWRSG